MDSARYSSFFLQPTDPRHRQYEALRAVLVDEQPMAAVAQRLGYRHDTVRALVSRFRQQFAANQVPPFSFHPTAADRPNRPRPYQPPRSRSPMPAP